MNTELWQGCRARAGVYYNKSAVCPSHADADQENDTVELSATLYVATERSVGHVVQESILVTSGPSYACTDMPSCGIPACRALLAPSC